MTYVKTVFVKKQKELVFRRRALEDLRETIVTTSGLMIKKCLRNRS